MLQATQMVTKIYTFYVYENSMGQVIPDESAFMFDGVGYSSVRPATMPNLADLRTFGRAAVGYTGNELLP